MARAIWRDGACIRLRLERPNHVQSYDFVHDRTDDGPEFIARQRFVFKPREGGSPWENGYCMSFSTHFRDELLNGDIFYTLKKAKIIIE